jgi:hypothetical protein
MPNDEEIKYLMNYYKDSLNETVSLAMLQKINNFISSNKLNLPNSLKNDYITFLSFLNSKLSVVPSDLTNLHDLQLYYITLHDTLNLLNHKLDLKDLNKIDKIFNYTYYLNLDSKNERLLESKLYKLLTENGYSLLNECLKKKLKINISLIIFLALDYLKNNKHVAQIITLNNLQKEDENLNLIINDNYTNEEILLYLYQECNIFCLTYHNTIYIYETNLLNILSSYDITPIKNLFYLNFISKINSYEELIKIYKRNNIDYSHLFTLKVNLFNSYYGLLQGIKTVTPYIRLYKRIDDLILTLKTPESKKDLLLNQVHKNKYEQLNNNSFYGSYLLSEEDIKKILLIIILSYSKNKTYSNFNRDIIKDIILNDINDVIKKYHTLEFQPNLQELYVLINKDNLYTKEVIQSSLKELPIDYYLLDKINSLI